MIVVFGSLSVEIHLDTEQSSGNNATNIATHHNISIGGKGASQATAAARSGADVTLIGKTGNDEFATILTNKLRDKNVETSNITRSHNLPTGINIHLKDASGAIRTFCSPAANTELSAEEISGTLLNNKAFVLTQTEITSEENILLLSKAKEKGATTIMNLAPSLDLSQKALDNLDYLIVNQDEARLLAEKLGLNVDDNALKIAEGLSKQGNLACIITVGDQGCVAYTADKKGWGVKALEIGDVIDRSGAQDAYCGVFAACLRAGMPMPRAMKRASIAASLACTKIGRVDSLPTLEDIDARINDLDDPEEIGA